jgi:uncharacterized protein with FMN-binding domain
MSKKIVAFLCFLLLIMGCEEKVSHKIRNFQLPNFDLSAVDNGRYTGGFKHYDYYYETEVVVQDSMIVDIEVLKSEGDKYDQEALPVLNRVIQTQSLDVDTVTGATKSSKIYLITIYNALSEEKVEIP